MSRHGPDPDRLHFQRVTGTARQLAEAQGSVAGAVVQIRAAAAGRDDLLTQGAGLGIGAWSVNPGLPTDFLAAGLLLVSVQHLDLDVLSRWLMVGQQRGLAGARHRA
jgi:hypothetical protein